MVERLANSRGRALTDDEYHRWPRLSPDGRLVVSVLQRADVVDELVLTDLATRRRTKVGEGGVRYPSWVDPRTLAYLSDGPGGRTRALSVDVSTLVTTELTQFDFAAAWLAVAPGGRRLAVEQPGPGSTNALLERDLDTRSDRVVARGQVFHSIRFGPDGSMLAWSGPRRSGTSTTNGVWIVRREGAAPSRLAPDGYGPLFSSDGATVFFARLDEFGGLYQVPVAGGRPRRLRTFGRGVSDFDRVRDRLVWVQESGRDQVYAVSLR